MDSPSPETITQRLFRLLGQPAVLLKIGYGEKRPKMSGWQTAAATEFKSGYFQTLDSGKHNIGVALGKQSGGLCSIDIDDDEAVEPFLDRNPRLRHTLRTMGKRGCNLWVRIEGEYPPLCKVRKPDGDPWGEWRADGGQTVIYGRHPDGMDYQFLVPEPAITIPFSGIDWGNLQSSWYRTDTCASEASSSADIVEAGARDLYHQLVREHGDPIEVTEKGSVKLNHLFFVAKYATEHRVLHEASEQDFYNYHDASGLWKRQTVHSVKQQFGTDLKQFADVIGEPQIHFMRNNALLGSLAELLRGQVERTEVFRLRRSFIHLANGMLHLELEPPELRTFSPDYFSRNQCPFALSEGADCPVFIAQLLESALDADDVDLLQRWAGSLLHGGNLAQRILLLTGTPGGGKSTFLEVIETIVGEDNIHELRTEHLHERFELQFFIGKTLLTGKDVPGDFLQRRGASMLKKLVGNDLISPEKKGVNQVIRMRGNFDVAITANSRLHVRLDGDAEAWRRRLIVVRYERPKPKQRVSDFGQKLLREEGSGILNWMLRGAIRHLEELKQHGDFVLSEGQQRRVDDLLAESDSVRAFIKECVRRTSSENTLTTEELVMDYRDYCERKGWEAQTQRQVERQLPDLMLEAYGLTRRHDIERDGRKQRGYAGVYLDETH